MLIIYLHNRNDINTTASYFVFKLAARCFTKTGGHPLTNIVLSLCNVPSFCTKAILKAHSFDTVFIMHNKLYKCDRYSIKPK